MPCIGCFSLAWSESHLRKEREFKTTKQKIIIYKCNGRAFHDEKNVIELKKLPSQKVQKIFTILQGKTSASYNENNKTIKNGSKGVD